MEEGRRIDLRLLPAVLAAWGSGLAVTAAREAVVPLLLVGGLGAVLAIAVTVAARRALCAQRPRGTRLSRDRVGLIAAQAAWCCGLIALVSASGGADWAAARGPAIVDALEHRASVQVRAVITGLVPDSALASGAAGHDADQGAATSHWNPSAPSARFEARATAIDSGEGWRGASAPLLVFGSIEPVAVGDTRAPGIGAEVTFEARLRPADGGTLVLAFASEPARQTSPPHPLLAWADDLRDRFTEATASLPGVGGELLPGLAVGDTRSVGADLKADMKTSSLTHLTAVSGANCAIVVGAIVLLGRLAGWRRSVRLAVAGAALAGFVVIVTPEGSVIRAAAMAAIVLAVDGWGRHVRGAPVLCLAVVALLAVSPALAADYGFALSVAATAGLLLGTRPLADRLARWMPSWLAMALAVPLAAQLACQPILILLSPVIPLHGVVANLLAAPAAPIATVAGLVGALLATIAPALATPVLWIAWVPAQWIGIIASGVADWPFASLPWPEGIGGALLLAALITAALVAWLRQRHADRRTRRRSWLLGTGVAIVLAVMLGSWLGVSLTRNASMPSDWTIASCDVGQGDATLVRSAGTVALIDTGPDAEPLAACLQLLGIARIDVLVLSHFDHDHDGAATSISHLVGLVLVPDTVEARAEPLVASLQHRGIEVRAVGAGASWRLGDATWRALWPRLAANGGPSPIGGNDGSLVVLVQPDAGASGPAPPSLLALGDAGGEPQRSLLAEAGWPVTADVVKVSHHGARDQAPELYEAIGARLGLVSVGRGNTYGHPTAEALAMLQGSGIQAARTDERGTIVVGAAPDGGLRVWSAGVHGPAEAVGPSLPDSEYVLGDAPPTIGHGTTPVRRGRGADGSARGGSRQGRIRAGTRERQGGDSATGSARRSPCIRRAHLGARRLLRRSRARAPSPHAQARRSEPRSDGS